MNARWTVLLLAAFSAGCELEWETPEERAGAAAQPADPGPMVQVKAEAGEGAKGRGYGGGVVSEPLRQRWLLEQKIIYDIQIKHSLDLYKAEHGYAPRTHEEFMQKIIQAGQIQLPELPAGHTYVYNPETEQLEIIRPENEAPPPVETPTIPFP